MDNRQMLFDLIEKFREILVNGHEYVVCNQMLKKISSVLLATDSYDDKLDLSEIVNLTDEELSMFYSPECKRIVYSLREISNKKGWRVDTVLRLVKRLQQDRLDNKMNEFKKKNESLDELVRIVEQGLFQENYNLILDFIKMSVDSKLLSLTDATNLNFYVLKSYYSLNIDKEQENKIEIVELNENIESIEEIRKKLQEVFIKYEYVYDENKMGDLDNRFVKYSNIDYVDYILSKFKEYDISSDMLYIRKRAFYSIVIDNDKETFDSVLDFINKNNCRLYTLLGIPAIFSKRKRSFIEKVREGTGSGDNVYLVTGAYQDFFDNMELYKRLSRVSVVSDEDLNRLGKFLCTPSIIVNKNLLLLERYGIITRGTLPKAIMALCGNDTEYIIDRLIEVGLYESYLTSRFTKTGEVKQARGTYFVDGDNNPFKFYKMKRANDMGLSILAKNGGIMKVFKDNSESYMGVSLIGEEIVQEPLAMDTINGINPRVRKSLPVVLRRQVNDGRISESNLALIYFNNLYKYKICSPVEIFASSDKSFITDLKGERIAGIFKKDYKKFINDSEIKNILSDNFIKLLDEALYCDSDGNSKPVKADDLHYEFSHPAFPNINIIISRHKVLRLCQLLKEDGCWINSQSSDIDKENTLLSVIVKDTIVSDTEMVVLRLVVREILTNGLIKVVEIDSDTKDRRGAR